MNATWAGLNLADDVLALRGTQRGSAPRWNADLVAFEAGYLVFAAGMAGTERLFPVNWDG